MISDCEDLVVDIFLEDDIERICNVESIDKIIDIFKEKTYCYRRWWCNWWDRFNLWKSNRRSRRIYKRWEWLLLKIGDKSEKYEGAKIVEEQFCTKTTGRSILSKLIEDLKEDDTLVVTKLDRIARNTDNRKSIY